MASIKRNSLRDFIRLGFHPDDFSTLSLPVLFLIKRKPMLLGLYNFDRVLTGTTGADGQTAK